MLSTLLQTSPQEPDDVVVLQILEAPQLHHEGPGEGSVPAPMRGDYTVDQSDESTAPHVLHGHDVPLVVDCLDEHLLVDVVPNPHAVQGELAGAVGDVVLAAGADPGEKYLQDQGRLLYGISKALVSYSALYIIGISITQKLHNFCLEFHFRKYTVNFNSYIEHDKIIKSEVIRGN